MVAPGAGKGGPSALPVNTYRLAEQDQDGRARGTLVFAGRVATVSTATYWCETASGLAPAEGPALSCPGAVAEPEESNAISDSTGAIFVYAFACPADGRGGDVDWYASCPPDIASTSFQIQRAGDSAISEILTAEAIGTEPARFLLIEPGVYRLTEQDGDWCHAESDNTNDAGEIIVEAGERTNVWIFHCPSS
jgi:hypothetical protein